MKTVSRTRAARKALQGLDARVAAEIDAKLASYAAGGSADVTRMVGTDTARMRVRDYRVIFEETADEIIVLAVGHRRDIYR